MKERYDSCYMIEDGDFQETGALYGDRCVVDLFVSKNANFTLYSSGLET